MVLVVSSTRVSQYNAHCALSLHWHFILHLIILSPLGMLVASRIVQRSCRVILCSFRSANQPVLAALHRRDSSRQGTSFYCSSSSNIMSTFKAIRVNEFGDPSVLKLEELPALQPTAHEVV
jgi:hypothetical protein